MSSGEDDYMSDAFLAKLDDKRPGLITGKKAERLIKEEKIRKRDEAHREEQRIKSRKRIADRMIENREDGLSTKVSEAEPENKGLKLMMKMGFKMGSGLGKDGEGRKDPVPINEIKTDKKGVGKSQKERRDKEIIKNNIARRNRYKVENERKMASDFKLAQRDRAIDSRIYKFVCQARKALLDLDSQNGVLVPEKTSYWPPGAVKVDNTAEPGETSSEELEMLKLNPLRSAEIIRKRVPDFGEDGNLIKNEECEEEDIDYSNLLEEITEVLRKRYRYCIYCGYSFNDDEDLEQNCPGNSYELHD